MEREAKRNTYVLHGDEEVGSVKIADDVIAIIAIGVPVVAYTMSKMNEHSEE